MTDRLSHAGFKPEMSATRGIDHGVWVPLRRMYPQADIPVVPLSVNPAGDAAHHLAVGRALSRLRAEGVLVVGSGGFVNNLGDLDWQHPEGPMPPWAAAFAGWMRERLAEHDIDSQLDWERQASHARHAHSTV